MTRTKSSALILRADQQLVDGQWHLSILCTLSDDHYEGHEICNEELLAYHDWDSLDGDCFNLWLSGQEGYFNRLCTLDSEYFDVTLYDRLFGDHVEVDLFTPEELFQRKLYLYEQ